MKTRTLILVGALSLTALAAHRLIGQKAPNELASAPRPVPFRITATRVEETPRSSADVKRLIYRGNAALSLGPATARASRIVSDIRNGAPDQVTLVRNVTFVVKESRQHRALYVSATSARYVPVTQTFDFTGAVKIGLDTPDGYLVAAERATYTLGGREINFTSAGRPGVVYSVQLNKIR